MTRVHVCGNAQNRFSHLYTYAGCRKFKELIWETADIPNLLYIVFYKMLEKINVVILIF